MRVTPSGRARPGTWAPRAALLLAGVTTLAVALPAPAGATSPRADTAVPLFAYADGTAPSPTTCPADTTDTPSVECSLTDALDLAGTHGAGNQVVYLATPGTSAHFVGNWTPDLSHTTAAHPMLIQPAPGLSSSPVLDGNAGSATGCPTGACDDAILTTDGPGHVDLTGFTMTNADNTDSGTGGAIDNQDATVVLTSMTFSHDAAAIDGGAIDSGDGATGTLTVTSSTFTSDSAASDGGAIDNADGGTGNSTVTSSTFTSNSAGADGGAIDNADVGTGNLSVTGSTFSSNTAGSNGGAIDHADDGEGTATVASSTFTGDTADDDGGAIDNGDDSATGPASLAVTASTFTTNAATLYDGGAIDNADAGEGTITASVSGSTLTANSAGSDGGAVDNGDGSTVSSAVTLTTSTLTANSALTGGAVDNADNSGLAQLVVSATTVSGNSGTAPGIENVNGTGTVATAADLLADACDQGTGWTDAGYDVGDATCLAGGPGSVTSSTVPSYLGALANNGGPTRTMLPLTGNAGIGAIPATKSVTLAGKSATLCPTTDQRGVASVAGRTCSAGSVQVAAPVITTASQATFVLSTPGTFTVRATGLPAPQFSEVGTLPPGVTLSAGGVLSGTPTRSGSFPITVTAHNSSGADAHQAFTLTVNAVQPQGYWLVGGDGGIFSYGAAHFYGSTGNLHLQRPVVAITPTSDRGGYWLVASDGGIFAFGDSSYHGSIPGIGLAPAGTPGTTRRLNAPIVGMVPSVDGAGYFMVASDGGVFAFGDARFSGSCPGIGGCSGAAVSVVPDADGDGYWVVTATGNVYAFGKAPSYGAPGARSVPVTSAVRYPDGSGYWILFADGTVWSSNSAKAFGGPSGLGGANPATAVFATTDGKGYWVATANGSVHPYGDATFHGDPSGSALNAPIIAASGF